MLPVGRVTGKGDWRISEISRGRNISLRVLEQNRSGKLVNTKYVPGIANGIAHILARFIQRERQYGRKEWIFCPSITSTK
jgi:hypothetical protein